MRPARQVLTSLAILKLLFKNRLFHLVAMCVFNLKGWILKRKSLLYAKQ